LIYQQIFCLQIYASLAASMIHLWGSYATVLAQVTAYFEALLGSLEHSQFKLLPLHRFGSAVFHSAFSSCAIPTSEAFPHYASL
jgi:hypothetical protein